MSACSVFIVVCLFYLYFVSYCGLHGTLNLIMMMIIIYYG